MRVINLPYLTSHYHGRESAPPVDPSSTAEGQEDYEMKVEDRKWLRSYGSNDPVKLLGEGTPTLCNNLLSAEEFLSLLDRFHLIWQTTGRNVKYEQHIVTL